jgi:hypothetical protein
MKALLAAVLATGLCGITLAQDKKADPVGIWNCEYDIGGQKREATLTVKKDGDKLAGTMKFQDKQEAKLKDVKFKDGQLTFSADRELMDMKFTLEYTLKIAKDSFKGKVAAEFGGEKREFDIEGKRAKKDEKKKD